MSGPAEVSESSVWEMLQAEADGMASDPEVTVQEMAQLMTDVIHALILAGIDKTCH